MFDKDWILGIQFDFQLASDWEQHLRSAEESLQSKDCSKAPAVEDSDPILNLSAFIAW